MIRKQTPATHNGTPTMKYLKRLVLTFSMAVVAACGGGGTSSTASSTSTNTAPVARAGADQSVLANAVVTLDGSASSDANNDALTYAWTLTTKPIGSLAVLAFPSSVKSTFTADVAGTFVASLMVNDGKVSSSAAIVTITVPSIPTAAGELDATFGSGGKVTSSYGGLSQFGPAVKIQSDGKIVVVGKHYNGHDDDFLVQRLYSNGTPDVAFGTNGATVIKLSSADDNAKGLVFQTDGKIIIAGGAGQAGSYETSVLVRVTADGAVDTSFGTGGKVLIDFGLPSHGHSVIVQSDGKIVVTGETYTSADGGMFAVARVLASGAADTGFGVNGKVTQAFGTGANAHSLALQADGKLLIGGYATNVDTGKTGFLVARFLSNGALDTSFGINGSSTVSIGTGNNYCHVLMVQADSKIVLSGSAMTATNYDFALARFTGNGALDTSFGANGVVTTNFVSGPRPSADETAGAVLQSDGKIVAGGYSDRKFALARYLSSGALDTSFGTGGLVTTVVGTDSDDWIKSLALQSWDGKIVAVGYSKNGSTFNLAVARYSGGAL